MFKNNDKVYIVIQDNDVEKYYMISGIIVSSKINSDNEVYVYLEKFKNSFLVNIDILAKTEYEAIEIFKKDKIKEIENICKSLETRKMKLNKLSKL